MVEFVDQRLLLFIVNFDEIHTRNKAVSSNAVLC